MFTVPSKLKLKNVLKRVVKSLFYYPKEIEKARATYREGEERILEELGQVDAADEGKAQEIYTRL